MRSRLDTTGVGHRTFARFGPQKTTTSRGRNGAHLPAFLFFFPSSCACVWADSKQDESTKLRSFTVRRCRFDAASSSSSQPTAASSCHVWMSRWREKTKHTNCGEKYVSWWFYNLLTMIIRTQLVHDSLFIELYWMWHKKITSFICYANEKNVFFAIWRLNTINTASELSYRWRNYLYCINIVNKNQFVNKKTFHLIVIHAIIASSLDPLSVKALLKCQNRQTVIELAKKRKKTRTFAVNNHAPCDIVCSSKNTAKVIEKAPVLIVYLLHLSSQLIFQPWTHHRPSNLSFCTKERRSKLAKSVDR